MFKKIQLKNGLKVLIVESQKSPVVSIQMWVKTGSADEEKGKEGISHFIEHLVFKGTNKFKVGEIAALIEASGGELNAYTSFDQTVFYVTLSNLYFETGLEVISEMMGFPKFDPDEINSEREVVLEELKRGKDSLGRVASELLFSTRYKDHPYGKPVIGYEKNIKSWSAKQIKEYFANRYAPANMFLVVAGSINAKNAVEQVKKHFNGFVKKPIKKVKRKAEGVQKKERIKVEKGNFEQSIGYLAWPIPDIKHKDIPAIDILAYILGQGDSSRLVRRLRIENAIVNSIGASSFSPVDQGLFGVSFGYNKEKLEPTLGAIREELTEIIRTPPSEDEMKKAVINIESEDLVSYETVDGLSRKYGSLEFYFQDPKYQKTYFNQLRQVTPAQISKIAKKYIDTKSINITVVTNDEPKKVTPQLTSWLKEFKKTSTAKTEKVKAKDKKIKHNRVPEIKTSSHEIITNKKILKNGTTVLSRKISETALVSIRASFLGGSRIEAVEKSGTVELMGRCWTGGTKTRTEAEIYNSTEKIAAGLGAVSGRHSEGLSMEVLSTHLDEGLDLFFDVLMNPLFPTECVDREKSILIEQIRSKSDNPAQGCMRLFMKNLFPNHTYGIDPMGERETVEGVSATDIQKHWSKINSATNLSLIIAGNYNDKALANIEQKLQGLPQGKKIEADLSVEPLKKTIQAFENNKREQSHVVFGFRSVSLNDEKRYTLQIIQSVLAGQGGRLFIELRDKNSLAYSVSPLRMEGMGTGYFGAYIGCSPEKVSKAISMMKEEFTKLCQEFVSASELERAKRFLLGRHDIDLQRTSAISSAILYNDLYGIDYDEAFNNREKYIKITKDDVLDLAQELFSKPHVLSVVGPTDPWSR